MDNCLKTGLATPKIYALSFRRIIPAMGSKTPPSGLLGQGIRSPLFLEHEKRASMEHVKKEKLLQRDHSQLPNASKPCAYSKSCPENLEILLKEKKHDCPQKGDLQEKNCCWVLSSRLRSLLSISPKALSSFICFCMIFTCFNKWEYNGMVWILCICLICIYIDILLDNVVFWVCCKMRYHTAKSCKINGKNDDGACGFEGYPIFTPTRGITWEYW